MLPKRRFWKRNSRSGVSLRVILRAFVAQIEYSHHRKVPRKDTPDLQFRFQNLRLVVSINQACATPPHSYVGQSPPIGATISSSALTSTRLMRLPKWSPQWGEIVQQMGRSGIRLVYPVFPFGWSMCAIPFCISWRGKSQDAYRTSRPIRFDWSTCDIRLSFLAIKITRCISHISTDSVWLVDVRYSVLYFLARKITRCISHISTEFNLCLPNEDVGSASRPAPSASWPPQCQA